MLMFENFHLTKVGVPSTFSGWLGLSLHVYINFGMTIALISSYVCSL